MGSQEHLQQPPGTTVTPRRRRHRRRRISKTARLAVAVPLLVAAVMWASASGWRPGVAAPTEPHAAAVGMDPTSHSAAAGVAASAAAAAAAAAGGGVAAEGPGGRQLQAGTPPAPEPEEEEDQLYPKEQFSKKDLKNGAFVLHMIGALYMFVALAIVCDEYFVPVLEVITEVTGVSDDVAGATFMAAGGSAPELFTSFIGVFISKSNVGFGTIVGSAVFNVLFVIGMCAVFSSGVLELTWWPLARDSSYYTLSLGVLVAFFWNGEIETWEACVLFLMYLGYVMLMANNERLYAAYKRRFGKSGETEGTKAQNALECGAGNAVRLAEFQAGVLHFMLAHADPEKTPAISKAKARFRRTSELVMANLRKAKLLGLAKGGIDEKRAMVTAALAAATKAQNASHKAAGKYKVCPETLPATAADAAPQELPPVIGDVPAQLLAPITSAAQPLASPPRLSACKVVPAEAALPGALTAAASKINSEADVAVSNNHDSEGSDSDGTPDKRTRGSNARPASMDDDLSDAGSVALCEAGAGAGAGAGASASANADAAGGVGVKPSARRTSEGSTDSTQRLKAAKDQGDRARAVADSGLRQMPMSSSNASNRSLNGRRFSGALQLMRQELDPSMASGRIARPLLSASVDGGSKPKIATDFTATADDAEAKEGTTPAAAGGDDKTAPKNDGDGKDEEETALENDTDDLLLWPSTFCGRLWFILTLPLVLAMRYTIPDVRNDRFKNWYILAFIMCITWIAVFSYLMVWWATTIGDALGIPEAVMGLTFLAAGTSVPDLLSSVIVARQGLGDMAVSSSIGSNIFDVLVGLPLPWLAYTIINGKSIAVGTEGLKFSVLVLVLMLAAVIVSIACSSWRMTKTLGGIMFGLYAAFMAINLLVEYDVVTPPL